MFDEHVTQVTIRYVRIDEKQANVHDKKQTFVGQVRKGHVCHESRPNEELRIDCLIFVNKDDSKRHDLNENELICCSTNEHLCMCLSGNEITAIDVQRVIISTVNLLGKR
jgi:hypothetical protein